MAAEKSALFSKGVYSLRQLVDKPEGLPCVVNTRDKLLSFRSVPIQPEGLHLCLEQEVEIDLARIKVLPFHDEEESILTHGAEFVILHSEFENEEFYIPLKFGVKLKFDSYRHKRPRFASVSEVFDQRPRYVRTLTDTMPISPRRKGGVKTKCVAAGSLLEVKDVVTLKDRQTRYLRCLTKSNKNVLFKENTRINFTAVSDDKEYTLKQIKEAGFWLPKPIQFKINTILQEHIVQFPPETFSDIVTLLTGILDLLEITRIRMLIGRAYDKQKKCFKTLLLPATLYERFHVQIAEFENPTQRSRYICKHFGKPSGRDDILEDKLFVLSATEDLVYWLQCSYIVDDDIEDTPDTDSSNYEQPLEVLKRDPPKPSFPGVEQRKADNGKDSPVFVQVVHLLPIVGIQDQNVLHNVIQKANLGFGQVHQELRSVFKRNENGERNRLISKQLDKTTPMVLSRPSEGIIGGAQLYDDTENLDKSSIVDGHVSKNMVTSNISRCERPLPDPPVDGDIEALDKMSKDDSNVNIHSMGSGFVCQLSHTMFPPSKRPLPAVPNQIQPSVTEKEARVNYEQHVSPDIENMYCVLEEDIHTPTDEEGDYIAMEDEMSTTAGTQATKPNPKGTAVCKEEKTSKALGFESYSVEETVDCFKKCGLDRLAAICEEHTLDGYFMINADQDTLKNEPLTLNPLQINKLRMIYKGWRPKHS